MEIDRLHRNLSKSHEGDLLISVGIGERMHGRCAPNLSNGKRHRLAIPRSVTIGGEGKRDYDGVNTCSRWY